MEAMIKNTQVSFRSNDKLVAKAKEIFSRKNIDMSLALNEFLTRTVQEDNLPFAIYDQEAERVFAELKAELDKAFQDYENGNYIPASEVEKKWGL